jgi:hypothetical protein
MIRRVKNPVSINKHIVLLLSTRRTQNTSILPCLKVGCRMFFIKYILDFSVYNVNYISILHRTHSKYVALSKTISSCLH